MFRFRSIFVIVALAVICLLGCRPNEQKLKPGYYYSDRQTTFEQLAEEDCVVRVNGVELTKRQWISLFKLDQCITELQRGVVAEGRFDEKEFARVSGAVLVDLIRRELFRQHAVRLHVAPSAEAVSNETKALLDTVKKASSLPFDRLCAAIGGEVGELLSQVPCQQARDLMLWRSVATNDLSSVSEGEIEARKRFVERFDATAARLNAQSRDKLLKAKKEMLAGAPFAEVARRYAEVSPEDAEEWCTVELGELPPDEDLVKWLSTAKVGEISEPLDLEDGLALVKLVKTGLGDPPPGVEPPKTYTMVKCTVRAYEHMRYQAPDEMSRQLLYWKRQEANKTLCVKLFSEAVVEYPNGTNFFPRAENPVKEAL